MSVATQKVSIEHHGFDVAGIFLLPNRPWLALYGLRLPLGEYEKEDEQSPIEKKLHDEIMLKLFARLGPYGLGVASCVCRHWNILAQQPHLWYKPCLDAFSHSTLEENIEIIKAKYNSSWKKMFLERPHLRFDGMYVAPNTYTRTGVPEWKASRTVHFVTYFRYLRFWPNGRFRYCTTPAIPRKVAAFMGSPINTIKKGKEPITLMTGDYLFDEGLTTCNAVFPRTPHIRFRIDVHLRSTTRGANNRLDVRKITTTEVGEEPEEDDDESVEEEEEPEDIQPNEELEHQRGLNSFLFVPWEKISSCILNTPQDMDFYIV